MKRLRLFAFYLIAIALLAGLVMVSCNSKTESEKKNYPKITEQGVAPFVLGASMRDIPQKGDYYDTIIYKLKYYVMGVLDTESFEWDEQQMEEYKKAVNNGETFYNDIDVSGYRIEEPHADCYVVSNGDTLMVIKCNADWKIVCVKILSDKLEFNNGIKVGLSSMDMNSKYSADFICEDYSILCIDTTEVDMGYRVPTMPENVQFFSSRNNKISFILNESEYCMIPLHGNKIQQNASVFTIPLEDVKDDCLGYIVIHGDCDHNEGRDVKNDFFKL